MLAQRFSMPLQAAPLDVYRMVTALNPYIGYDQAAAVAKEALATGKTLREIVLAKKLMDAATLDRALDPLAMTKGGGSALGG